jgi:hypothetical protein
MIGRRDQFNHDPIQMPRFVQDTGRPDFNLVADAHRTKPPAPIVSGRVDFLAAATERIIIAFKVIYRKRETLLLTAT